MKKQEYPKTLDEVILYFAYIVGVLFVITMISFLVGCESKSDPVEEAPKPISLSWENTTAPHPERKPWSEYLIGKISEKKAVLDTAKDIGIFCPNYGNLDQNLQMKAWGELWVAVAYYESGYNPKTSSVDVGKPGDKDTYSVGLYQMSVVDQKNYKIPLGYKLDDLLTAKPNIHLAIEIFALQIAKRGKVFIPKGEPGLYWAVIHPGGKYDKTKEIIARTKKHVPECE